MIRDILNWMSLFLGGTMLLLSVRKYLKMYIESKFNNLSNKQKNKLLLSLSLIDSVLNDLDKQGYYK